MNNQINNQNISLKIGDEIGFVILGSGVDSQDETIFFEVCEVSEIDGETAYRYQFPNGEVSRSFVRQSSLKAHAVKIKPRAEIEPEMLCLSDRQDEFYQAVTRAQKGDLEVFAAWDDDSFVVKNYENGKEYQVRFQTANGKVFGECECADHVFRKRICKHLSKVLVEKMFRLALG